MPSPDRKKKRSAPAASDPALAWSSGPSAVRDAESLVSISKALSIAQMFLSVDDADGAQAWFNRRLKSADDPDRLGDLMALSQLRLLRKAEREYAALVTDRARATSRGDARGIPSKRK